MQTLENVAEQAEAFKQELQEVAVVARCMSQVLTATVAKDADRRCVTFVHEVYTCVFTSVWDEATCIMRT